MIKKVVIGILLLLLIFVAIFPRSIEVLNQNPVFGTDQGRDYLAAKSIVADHKLTLIGAELGAGEAGLQYLIHGPGYFYLIALAFILFHGNPVGGVFFMLLFGLAAIVFGMYFIAKIFGKKEALLMGFLVALCPFFIGQSRLMENHFPSLVFIMLIFYLVYLYTKNPKKDMFFFWASFVSAAIYNFEFALSIPLSLTLFLYIVILLKRQSISRIPIFLLGIFFGFAPMILFEAKHHFMGMRSAVTYLVSHHTTSAATPVIGTHVRNIFNLFVYSFSDSFPGKLLLPIIIILPLFVILVGFIIYKEENKTFKNFFTYILLLYPVNFFVFIFLRNIIFQHYIIDLYFVNLLLTVYVVSFSFRMKHTFLALTLSLYLFVLFSIGIKNAYAVSLYDYHDYGGFQKVKGKLDAIDFIYKDAGNKPFGLFTFDPAVYTYPYDYLIWWRGNMTYHHFPTQIKKGTFYLLIEKDDGKPWSYIGWEVTVIKTGKIIFTKTLPSGLIVEKRLSE